MKYGEGLWPSKLCSDNAWWDVVEEKRTRLCHTLRW
jgi:hypothetical protein